VRFSGPPLVTIKKLAKWLKITYLDTKNQVIITPDIYIFDADLKGILL
jgi:hypothetical protein